jgi:nucleoside-diphosphate-sugar epimerase
MSRHVVFGAGQIGAHIATQLLDAGHEVVVVSRSARNTPTGARAVSGDLTNFDVAANAATGATAIYFCLNASNYGRWPEEFPPLQRAALHAAKVSGARLVVLENMYAYGPTGGRPITETLPTRATAAKALTRIAMTNELLKANHSGSVDVTIGRASDFFGPGVTHSALGEHVMVAALNGKRAQVMGRLDLPHSYSYAPDVARGLIALGGNASAGGQIWHLPIAETTTTRRLITEFFDAAGHRAKITAANRPMLMIAGLFKADLKELRHTFYQFGEPWTVDDSKFRSEFGDLSTPLPIAVKETVDWYRSNPPKEKS